MFANEIKDKIGFLISVFFTIIICSKNINIDTDSFQFNTTIYKVSQDYIWPTPGYNTITSRFGYRTAPTSGASSYHGGIDIAAPAGSNIVATCSGKVTYTGFYGAGGFTVIIKSGDLSFEYCHVSPNFLVSVNDYVSQGDVIAKVGPKNVYGVSGNKYKDANGNPTNGATTGPHLHFSIKKDGKAVNPNDYLLQ